MSRILAIDYGTKRIGLAVTDNLQLIANPLTTVASKDIFDYLTAYMLKEKIECFVVGDPKRMNNEPSQVAALADTFVKRLQKLYPEIKVVRADERFTSKMAFQSMIDAGLKKKDRSNKSLIDKTSATLLLQNYMNLINTTKTA